LSGQNRIIDGGRIAPNPAQAVLCFPYLFHVAPSAPCAPLAANYQLFIAVQQVIVRRTHGIVNAASGLWFDGAVRLG
jgi:hypothetical protein